jgi:uncharacterized protein with HEPN domain
MNGFISFKNILIHQYSGVDLSEVWLTVENDLSVLKEAVKIRSECATIQG